MPYVKEYGIEYTPGQEYYRNYSKRAEAALTCVPREPVQSITAFADVMYRYLCYHARPFGPLG